MKSSTIIIALGACIAASSFTPAAVAGDESKSAKSSSGFSAGIDVRPSAKVAETGLPQYPGSKQVIDSTDENHSASLNLWGGNFGLKLAAVKLTTSDSPKDVATFYKKALTQYGLPLDCSNARDKKSTAPKNGGKELTCDNDHPKPGHLLFKSGSKALQHMVAIEPFEGGSRIHLVYLETRGVD